MGKACSMHETDEKYVQISSRDSLRIKPRVFPLYNLYYSLFIRILIFRAVLLSN